MATQNRLKPLSEVSDPSQIKVKHPGILEVPEGKFLDTGADHFIKLAKKHGAKGHEEVSHALSNLVRWNQGKGGEHDKTAKHAEAMIGAVHAHFEKTDKPEKDKKEESFDDEADMLEEIALEVAAASMDEEGAKKFIAKAIKKPGALRAHFGLSADAPIPAGRARAEQSRLHKHAEELRAKGQKLPEKDSKLLRRLNLFLKVLKPAAKAKTGEVAHVSESDAIDHTDRLLQEMRQVLGA